MILGSQLYVGEHERSRYNLDELESLVRSKAALGAIDFLAIWCAGDPCFYERSIRVCDELGIVPYLWFPVLADIDAFKITTNESVQLFDGSKGNGRSGKWDGLGKDEDFLFICPNDNCRVDRNFDFFGQLLDSYKFGGVMLDRIRYPSFANGIESVFTCFCDECSSRFGSTPLLSELNRRIKNQIDNGMSFCTENASSIEELIFGGELWSLSEFRKKSITSVVGRFAEQASVRGLPVGLDLFAPSLAGVVGQDYPALVDHCDWIKPMLYCFAMGPAGLPLEIRSLVSGISELCTKTHAEIARREVYGLLGLDLVDGVHFSDMFCRELQIIRTMDLGVKKVLAGIEAIDNKRVGLTISPSIISDYLDQISGLSDGAIASWNIVNCSDENLRQFGKR